MKKRKRKLFSMFLAFSLIFNLLPSTIAFADVEETDEVISTNNFLNLEAGGDPDGFDSTSHPYTSNDNSFMMATHNELLLYNDNQAGGHTTVYENYSWTGSNDVFDNMDVLGPYRTDNLKEYDYVQGIAGNFLGDTDSGRDRYVAYIGLTGSGNYIKPMLWVQDSMTGYWMAEVELNWRELYFKDLRQVEASSLFDIVAGDFDGDGVDTIVVYAAGYEVAVSEYKLVTNSDNTHSLSLVSYIPTSDVHPFAAWPIEYGDFWNDNIGSWQKPARNLESAASGDMAVGDVDGDGRDELIVVVSTNDADDSVDSIEIAYHGTWISVWEGHSGSFSSGRSFWSGVKDVYESNGYYGYTMIYSPGVTVGDLDGDGSDEIVVAGMLSQPIMKNSGSTMSLYTDDYNNVDALSDSHWGATVYSFAGFTSEGSAYSRSAIQGIEQNAFTKDGLFEGDDILPKTPIECVAFSGTNQAEHVFLGGTIYQVDLNTNWTEKFTPDMFNGTAGSGYTNTNIESIAVGNFDNNALGREQIVYTVLKKQTSYEDYYIKMGLITASFEDDLDNGVYGTTPSFSETGIGSSSDLVSDVDGGIGKALAYVPIAVDCDNNDGVEARIAEIGWVYSDPEVKAVLQAAPNFDELGGFDNFDGGTTSYGITTGYEFGTSSSDSVSFSGGAFVELEVPGFGISVEGGYNMEWSKTYEESLSTEYTTTFTAQSEDTVALMRTLIYLYTYEIKDTDGYWQTDGYTVSVPQAPTYLQLSLDDYNAFVDEYNALLGVGYESNYLKKITDADLPADNEGNPYAYFGASWDAGEGYAKLTPTSTTYSLGYSGGVTEVEWSQMATSSVSTETSHGFYYGITMKYGSDFAVGSAWAGGTVNLEYMDGSGSSETTINGNSAAASVADINKTALMSAGISAEVIESYGFNWDFITWERNLCDNMETTPFFGYMLTNVKSAPPAPFDLVADENGEDYVALSWSVDESTDERPYSYFNLWIVDDSGNYINLNTVEGVSYWKYDDDTAQYTEVQNKYLNNGTRSVLIKGLESNTEYTFVVSTYRSDVTAGSSNSLYSDPEVCTTPKAWYTFNLVTSPVGTADVSAKYNVNQTAKSGEKYEEDVMFTLYAEATTGRMITGIEVIMDGVVVDTIDTVYGSTMTAYVTSTGDTTYRVLTDMAGGKVTYGASGNGEVSATVSGNKLNSGETVTGEVLFKAVPEDGYYLKDWDVTTDYGNYTVDADGSFLTVTPMGATYVQGNFAEIGENQYTISVSTGWRCPVIVKDDMDNELLYTMGQGEVTVPIGTKVTLTANVADGFTFYNWAGDLAAVAGTENPYTMTIKDNLYAETNYGAGLTRTLNYYIWLQQYLGTSNTFTQDSNVGTIVATNDAGTIANGEELLPTDTDIVLTATPSNGYAFYSWFKNDSWNVEYNGNVLTIPVMDQSYTNMGAVFVQLPEIHTDSVADAEVGVAYSATIDATIPDDHYYWKISEGDLPDGLTLSGGVISGTPTTAGRYEFVVELYTSYYGGQSAQQQYVIVVEDAFVPVEKVVYTGDLIVDSLDDVVEAGYVYPSNATVQAIEWSLDESTSTLTATVVGGGKDREDFEQEFDITVEYIPITNISGIPEIIEVLEASTQYGSEYYEIDNISIGAVAVIEPVNSTVTDNDFWWLYACEIEWDCDDTDNLNKYLTDRVVENGSNTSTHVPHANITETITATATVTITIPDGIADGEDYVQVFVITGTIVAQGEEDEWDSVVDEPDEWSSEVSEPATEIEIGDELTLPKGTTTITKAAVTVEPTAVMEVLENNSQEDNGSLEETQEPEENQEESQEPQEEPQESESQNESEPSDAPAEVDNSPAIITTSEPAQEIERAASENTEEVDAHVYWEITDDGGTFATLSMDADGTYSLTALRAGTVTLQATIYNGKYDGTDLENVVKTYEIAVNGDDDTLSGITVEGATLVPEFSPDVTTYTATVGATKNKTYVTATGSGSITVELADDSAQTATANNTATLANISLPDDTPVEVTITDAAGTEYTVTINRPVIRVSSVTLAETYFELDESPLSIEDDLGVLVSPINATYSDIIWRISDTDATGAVLEADGSISVTTTGTFTLTATIAKGTSDTVDYEKAFTITVYEPTDTFVNAPKASPAGGTYAEEQEVTLSADEGTTIYYTLDDTEPDKTTSTEYTGAITISEDKVLRAIAVNATGTESSELLARYTIAAVIEASAEDGGVISPSGNVNVAVGDSQTFTITANSGYKINKVLVDGNDEGAISSYTFYDVAGDHTIAATFIQQHTIIASAEDGGTITPSGSTTVLHGGNQEYTIKADEDYQISKVWVDGKNEGAIESYTFEDVEGNHSIIAQFTQGYIISASATTGGTITDPGETTVYEGNSKTYYIQAEEDYRISEVLVDGEDKGVIGSHTFENVAENHTIAVKFIKEHTIIPSVGAGGGGSISPSVATIVEDGSSQTFTFTPDTGYRISNILVNGVSLDEIVAEYTFTNVSSNNIIKVEFTKGYTITATAGTGGSISPSGIASVDEGETIVYTVVANSGYRIGEVLIDDDALEDAIGISTGTYEFASIDADHTIDVRFVKQWSVTASAGEGGAIEPLGITNVDEGEDQEYTITVNADYELYEVYVDGVSMDILELVENTYTFENITAPHIIEVTFKSTLEEDEPSGGGGGGGGGGSSSSTEEVVVEEVIVVPPEELIEEIPFIDVDESDENLEGIVYVYENGIMAGISENEFGGELSITRAMIAAILFRLDGSETVDAEMTFADVPWDQYYAEAVRWGQDTGVVAGFSDEEFVPNLEITNEQFAAFLYRYAALLGMDMTISDGANLLRYADVHSITGYAYPAMLWAVDKGILGDGTMLNPTAPAQRAEVATALMGFMELMNAINDETTETAE